MTRSSKSTPAKPERETVRLRALKHFDNYETDQIVGSSLPLDERTQALVDAGYFEVVNEEDIPVATPVPAESTSSPQPWEHTPATADPTATIEAVATPADPPGNDAR